MSQNRDSGPVDRETLHTCLSLVFLSLCSLNYQCCQVEHVNNEYSWFGALECRTNAFHLYSVNCFKFEMLSFVKRSLDSHSNLHKSVSFMNGVVKKR